MFNFRPLLQGWPESERYCTDSSWCSSRGSCRYCSCCLFDRSEENRCCWGLRKGIEKQNPRSTQKTIQSSRTIQKVPLQSKGSHYNSDLLWNNFSGSVLKFHVNVHSKYCVLQSLYDFYVEIILKSTV